MRGADGVHALDIPNMPVGISPAHDVPHDRCWMQIRKAAYGGIKIVVYSYRFAEVRNV